MYLPQALAEAKAAQANVEEWIRAVNRRKVDYVLLDAGRDAWWRKGTNDYLYKLVGEALGFLGRHGEFDEAKRLIEVVEAYEEALVNMDCAKPVPTDLQQMHDDHEDVPDYLR